MMVIYAASFGLLVGGMVFFLALFFYNRYSMVRRRLQPQAVSQTDVLRPMLPEKPAFLNPALVEKLETKLALKKDSPRFKELQKTLIRAGIYNERGIPIFLGIKLGLIMVLPVLALFFLWGILQKQAMLIGIFFAVCLLGYFLPNLILDHLAESRQRRIRESLPDALDLLVVCVEAGQGLNAALKRVADDMSRSNPVIAQELLMVNLEINAGMEREQALRNLGERTGVDEIISLCNILIQSERFGTSISQALKTQSDVLRTTRRQKLEELAAKTPVKLVFPLLLFIFPAIIVVILGPAAIRISDFFSK